MLLGAYLSRGSGAEKRKMKNLRQHRNVSINDVVLSHYALIFFKDLIVKESDFYFYEVKKREALVGGKTHMLIVY